MPGVCFERCSLDSSYKIYFEPDGANALDIINILSVFVYLAWMVWAIFWMNPGKVLNP